MEDVEDTPLLCMEDPALLMALTPCDNYYVSRRPPFGDENTCSQTVGASPGLKHATSHGTSAWKIPGGRTPLGKQPQRRSRKRGAEEVVLGEAAKASSARRDSCLQPISRNLRCAFVSAPDDSPSSDISQSSILSSFSKHIHRGTPTPTRNGSFSGNGLTSFEAEESHRYSAGSSHRTSETLRSPFSAVLPKFSEADGYYFRHLRKLEIELSPRANVLPNKSKASANSITVGMRCMLVSWLFEVTPMFPLLPESLVLGVSILDRYLAAVPETKKNELQLVGICCLLIAAKYEETVLVPSTKTFCEMTDNTYKRAELVDMETKVLSQLDHRVGAPTGHAMLWSLNQVLRLDHKTLCMACYLLELSLLEYEMLQFQPSTVAASAVFLATATLGQKMSEGSIMFLEENCAEGIVPCVKLMNEVHNEPCECEDAMQKIWWPIWQKYQSPGRGSVATIPAQVLLDDDNVKYNSR